MFTTRIRPAEPARFSLDRNFRILVSGSFISMLGDQFALAALPWLVLMLSGGAPPFLGLFAKLYVIEAAINRRLTGLL